MEYSGVRLPGIFCPDESIEQFARLYGSDHFSKMMIMATNSPPRTVQATTHSPPGMMEGNPSRFYGNAKSHDRNLKVNQRYATKPHPIRNREWWVCAGFMEIHHRFSIDI
ncbi:uncharacterized protein LOC122621304 isoform X4 [Drosophila teissieri]|uniref:uncharacterized protein LOC122621304 isoform X4 n=1 Tax=Drosophila teissieri TaxID=7243 RepID=UPI001CBA47EE|nr:uncharacterized protein LOC122621304 isoform X4 [Drosophila teissieri]